MRPSIPHNKSVYGNVTELLASTNYEKVAPATEYDSATVPLNDE